jgi:hypothetical protein
MDQVMSDKDALADELAREFFVEMRTGLFADKPWNDLDPDTKFTWRSAARKVVGKGWAKVDFWTEDLTDVQVEGLYNRLSLSVRLRLAAQAVLEAASRRWPNMDTRDCHTYGWNANSMVEEADAFEKQEHAKALIHGLAGWLGGSIGDGVIHYPTPEELAKRLVSRGWVTTIPEELSD